MVMRTLNSTEDVIEALGGNQAVAAITRRNKDGVVWNWKDRKTFPANTYVVLKAALKERGLSAPDSLWGMTP